MNLNRPGKRGTIECGVGTVGPVVDHLSLITIRKQELPCSLREMWGQGCGGMDGGWYYLCSTPTTVSETRTFKEHGL